MAGSFASHDVVSSRTSLVVRAVVAGVCVAGGMWVLGRTVDPFAWLTVDGLREAIGHGWSAPVLYVGTVVASMFTPIPKIVLLGFGGVLFGPMRGFVLAWIGQIAGMTLLFVLARTVLRDAAQEVLHSRMALAQALEGHLERHGFRVIALLRLLYFMGTPLSIVLSTTRVRLGQFAGGTAAGVIPAVALAVLSGDAVVAGATGPKAAAIGVLLAIVLGGGALVRRRFGV